MKKLATLIVIIHSTLVASLSFASENSLYEFKWLDEDEKVYVIQNKEHVKSGHLGIDFSYIDSNSSPYQDTTGFSLTLVYYLSENWSLDLTYKQYSNSNSADLENLLNAYSNEVKPLIRRVDTAKLLHINWIPFYGKINTFNKIFFFDWGLGLGFGQFDTAGNYKTFKQKNLSITLVEEQDTGFNFRSFVKFYLGENLTMGFEYNLSGVQTILKEDESKEVLYFNDIIGTIGYLF